MKKIVFLLIYLLICTAALCGCNGVGSTNKNPVKPIIQETTKDAKDKKILCVITGVDEENSLIEFYKVDTEETNRYSFDAGTKVLTKAGRDISIKSVPKGSVVDMYYDPNTYIISKVQISKEKKVWENSKVTSFFVDETTKSLKVGTSLYYYKDDVYVVSDGEKISINQLTQGDTLIVHGIDNRIISIVVDKGHGYLTLEGEDIFVGGLVDVGGTLVKVIEDDMLLIVPEGVYKVEVRKDNNIAEKYVTVVRGERCVADFSDVAANVTTTGSVKFNINIKDAKLYIDNIGRNHLNTLTLTTGKHTIVVMAEGYNTYKSTIEVEAGHKSIDIILNIDEESETETEKETSSKEEPTTQDGEKETTTQEGEKETNTQESEKETNTQAGEKETEKPTSGVTGEKETIVSQINDVTIIGPVGGLVYFDSEYKGVAPVTFDMVTGTHVISIISSGGIESYTVTLAEGGDDVTYDFSKK